MVGSKAFDFNNEIRCPSGLRQQIDNPAINTLHRLTEPE
jgi:hypothetical protein